jgi:D-alanyl-D-alanine carboxypeptidase (penicillin-binding protein 5/6)
MRSGTNRYVVGAAALACLLAASTVSARTRATQPARGTADEGEEGSAATPATGGKFSPEAPYRAALVIDRDSGQVIFAKNEHLQWPPASMTKMMTLLITMERVRDKAIGLDDVVTASAWASKIGGSQVYLREGERFPLRELLKAIVIASANDGAVAVAEYVAGSTGAFVDLMNQRAKELGLTETEFHSVHGLPPAPGQKPDLMSAMDLAIVARKLAEFPEIMEWAKMPDAPFRDGQLQMRNTNHLVRTYQGADGLKTGFYNAAGFEVTATATRNGLRLLAVLLGAPTKKGCFDETATLLTNGFAGYRTIQAATAGQPIGGAISVAGGSVPTVTAVAAADLRLTVPRTEAGDVKIETDVPPSLSAPIKKGQVVGALVARRGDQQLGRVDVVAPQDVESTSWWRGWF